MKRLIHHLRRQPESTRRHILHGITVIFGVVLISLWIYSLGVNLRSPETKIKATQDLQQFSTLKDNIVGGYQNLSDVNAGAQQ